MMQYRKVFNMRVVAALAVCLSTSTALAGAFNQSEGQGQVILSSAFTGAGDRFDLNGRIAATGQFRKFETTALVEYGLTDWLTLIAKPALVSVPQSGVAGATYSGFGAAELGAQARLLQFGSSVVSLQASARLPGAPDSANPAVPRDATRAEQELRLLAGTGFQLGFWSSFADAQVAHRWRHGGPPNEWRVDLTLGTRPLPELMLMLQSFNTLPAGGGAPGFARMSQHKLQASAVYDVSKAWSVQLGVFTTVAGRDALRERGVLAAVWRRF